MTAHTTPTTADAQRLTTLLHFLDAATPATLAERMLRGGQPQPVAGAMLPEQTQEAWFNATVARIGANNRAWVAEFKGHATALALRSPEAAAMLHTMLDGLHRNFAAPCAQTEAHAASIEQRIAAARPQANPQRRWPWSRNDQQGEQRHPYAVVLDTVDWLLANAPSPALQQQVEQARQARATAEGYKAADNAVLHVLFALDQIDQFREGVDTARDTLRAAVAGERAAAVAALARGDGPNDLPWQNEAYARLTVALAREFESAASAKAHAAVVVNALLDTSEPGLPLASQALRARLVADLAGVAPQPRVLTEAVGAIGDAPGDDDGAVERTVTEMLRGFTSQPAVALTTPPQGTHRGYFFQVIPPGQRRLSLTVHDPSLAPETATYVRDGAQTRVAFVELRTNFDLACVDAYRAILPALRQAQQQMNCFALPEMAATLVPPGTPGTAAVPAPSAPTIELTAYDNAASLPPQRAGVFTKNGA